MKKGILIFLLLTAVGSYGQEGTCSLYVPNTLTPDCDGYGCELLEVISSCPVSDYHIQIYNRWGEVIFESKKMEEKWSSAEVPEGVYVWNISGKFGTDDDGDGLLEWSKFETRGHITILK